MIKELITIGDKLINWTLTRNAKKIRLEKREGKRRRKKKKKKKKKKERRRKLKVGFGYLHFSLISSEIAKFIKKTLKFIIYRKIQNFLDLLLPTSLIGYYLPTSVCM